MQIDFSTIEDVESFVTIPEGVYVCRVAEVREGRTRDGSPRWALRLEVAEGDLAGRTAAWDGLAWSERGLPRVKQVLGRMGFDVSGRLDVASGDLIDRRVRVQLFVEDWEDPINHKRITRLRVPYMGYEAVEEEAFG